MRIALLIVPLLLLPPQEKDYKRMYKRLRKKYEDLWDRESRSQMRWMNWKSVATYERSHDARERRTPALATKHRLMNILLEFFKGFLKK